MATGSKPSVEASSAAWRSRRRVCEADRPRRHRTIGATSPPRFAKGKSVGCEVDYSRTDEQRFESRRVRSQPSESDRSVTCGSFPSTDGRSDNRLPSLPKSENDRNPIDPHEKSKRRTAPLIAAMVAVKEKSASKGTAQQGGIHISK